MPTTPDTVFAPPLPSAGACLRWQRLYGASLGLALSSAVREHRRPLVVVANDSRSLQRLHAELLFFLGDKWTDSIIIFPDWECLPYDNFSPHPDIISQRLFSLLRLPKLEQGIVLLTVPNLLQRLPPNSFVDAYSFDLKVGQTLNFPALQERLTRSGYARVSQVIAPGEFAVRGGVLDVFPMGTSTPFRLDLFGDEVESIRFFDPDSQRSSRETDRILLLPAREVPMDDPAIRFFRTSYRAYFEGDPRSHPMYRDVSAGLASPGIEFFFPLFFENTATLFDYLPPETTFIFDQDLRDQALAYEGQITERFSNSQLDKTRPMPRPEDLYISYANCLEKINSHSRIEITSFKDSDTGSVAFAVSPPRQMIVHAHDKEPFTPFINAVNKTKHKILLVAESRGRRENLLGILRERDIYAREISGWDDFLQLEEPALAILDADIERGLFIDDGKIEIITESQIFGEQVYQRRRRKHTRQDANSLIRALSDLSPGDPVVHQAHGVGRYRGLTTLEINNQETEFVTLEYLGGDKLYVPVLSLDLINRYISGHPDHAPLHKLGNDVWIKAKRKAQEKAYDMAVELLEVEARRASHTGTAITGPDEMFHAFCADFPFEETPDQLQVIDDVIKDMSSTKPMDRIVCGDVGFGKTEIALRAAFLTVQSGHQVAMLVPTTLLAQQHFDTFSDRYADFPITVELLSRFRSQKEIRNTIQLVFQGKIDIVIGTHRLLQKDVSFRDIGLIIIDEEHRFGVRQKEVIKRLRSQTDILSLSATPIPRTLNLAMSGLRDVSILATPPKERLSVKTFVRDWSDSLIKEACQREVRRGGQVYVVHNDVSTIEEIADQIRTLAPEAEVRVGHGQMPERELEFVMRDFYHRRFQILVCTTIIESGIDIPTANTIIINLADRFGLAQLHQLRGRVGRSHHQAFAYLLVKDRRHLTGDALQRLQVIESLDELGAGFALASHDLEIRGAGEILGESQSGLIDDVGYSMYVDLLRRAIQSVKNQGGVDSLPLNLLDQAIEINLHISALFPGDYLPDVHARLVMYKRINETQSDSEVEDLKAEAIDRFGPLPTAASNIFQISNLKRSARRLGIKEIDVGPNGGKIVFSDSAKIDPAILVRLIEAEPVRYRMAGPTTLRFDAELKEQDERLRFISALLSTLSEHQIAA